MDTDRHPYRVLGISCRARAPGRVNAQDNNISYLQSDASLARAMRPTRARRRSDERGATNEHDGEVRLREPDHARPWGARLHSVRATMLPRLWRLPRICHVLRPMCRRAP